MCAQSEWNFANCSNNCPLFEGCAECTAAPGDGCAYCLTEEVCVGGDDAHKCRCARESCGVCEAKTGCADCTDDPACGWCASANGGKGGCLPAFDQHEPCDKGACPAPLAKNWQYGKCAVNCTLFSASCAECTAHYADSGCEWCEATEACLAPAQFTSCPACLVSTCPDCGSYESCSECIGDASCGWCSESEACVPGEAGGACGGPQVCPAPEWNYETCAADCASLETCTACTAMATEAGCRWCADEGICRFGPEFNGTACRCVRDFCPATSCSALSGTSCAQCVATQGCGWCPETASCLSGSDAGPCSSTAQCKAGWSYGTCDGTCGQHGDCTSCRADTEAGCGWCAGTQAFPGSLTPVSLCVQADTSDSAPADGRQCARWYGSHSSETCPACGDSEHNTCQTCTTDASCGWCGEFCREGDANGPFNSPGCSSWSFGDCQSECPLVGNCGDCVQVPECGWCKNPLHIGGFCTGVDSKSQCYEWQPSNCEPECETNLVCSACTANSSCGWCESKGSSGSTATCVRGTGQGPLDTTCSLGWSYGHKSCVSSCARYLDCGSCVLNADCGWCSAAGGACMAGKFDGPDQGVCPPDDWTHAPSVCSSPFDNCCYSGHKSSPIAPNTCPRDWLFASCSAALPIPARSKELSPWVVAAITAGAILVPIVGGAAYMYRRYLAKYGYPALEG
ncbi:uncharacterized protein AMSG_03742 [Thecamonas trahens ATCC 50062]|uniref:PSI domain-containing protein n=1 Tax=Thecamonas trahens ATCC 50062 TaxID=461836 RepID=A0A0L0D4M3_THETB|nr:hypothetical protein AMSG_03742 [Thecamonas trahens ATCC 50062]KNC47307.1 hypothetical protein AMSG_03742 [Thecamonas trahens ATCC 50062]|eukprot:XP_013759648.1 hypothetical protein AMSG_03742 [Thecamonas trahens ATCC 50062]